MDSQSCPFLILFKTFEHFLPDPGNRGVFLTPVSQQVLRFILNHLQGEWLTLQKALLNRMNKKVPLAALRLNDGNPRIIKDYKFQKLVKSILTFPEMLSLREIVADETMSVLGGNMRLRAMLHIAQMTEQELSQTLRQYGAERHIDYWMAWHDKPMADVKVAEGLSDEQKKEFIVKDNVGYGEWDWDMLANEWDVEELSDWGVDLPIDWGGDKDKGVDIISPDDFGDEFNLPNEGKSEFGTMTFVVTEEQRELILECLNIAQYCDGFNDDADNKNRNGEGLRLIVAEWKNALLADQNLGFSEVEKNKEDLRLYLCKALEYSKKKAKDVDELLGTNGMSGHYFGKSQWMFPTREAYEKMKTIMPLDRDYLECKNIEKKYNKAKILKKWVDVEKYK